MAAATATVDVAGVSGAAERIVTTTPARSRAHRLDAVDDAVRRSTLQSGVRVVSDPDPRSASASIGVYVGVGSRDELPESAGACHFLEHLLFKGTHLHSAHEINTAVDAVGGDLNAYTSREATAFFIRVPADAQTEAASLLCELVAQPALRADDVETEREVILEELSAVLDTPDELVSAGLCEAVFPDHGLGWEIVGNEASLEAMTAARLGEHHRRHYGGPDVVVAAVGDVDHDELVGIVSRGLPADGEVPTRSAPPDRLVERSVWERDIEQVHLGIGWRGLWHDHPDRYALAVLLHALGDGPSSRLYRRIRDERGLAYSVFTSQATFADTGMVTVSCSTSPEHLDECRTIVDEEIAAIASDGLSTEELRVAIGYLTGSMVLAFDDPSTRLARLGMGELVRGGVIRPSVSLAGYESVTADDVIRVAREVLGGPRAVAAVGPLTAADL